MIIPKVWVHYFLNLYKVFRSILRLSTPSIILSVKSLYFVLWISTNVLICGQTNTDICSQTVFNVFTLKRTTLAYTIKLFGPRFTLNQFHPCLIFARRARACPSGAPNSAPIAEHQTYAVVSDTEKRTSLLFTMLRCFMIADTAFHFSSEFPFSF